MVYEKIMKFFFKTRPFFEMLIKFVKFIFELKIKYF